MKPFSKKIIAVVLSAFILLLIYLGSYLPLKKSQLYINAMANSQKMKVHTFEEFNKIYNPVFEYKSPIGNDEITTYHLGTLLSIISQQSNKAVVDALIQDAEEKAAPMLKSRKGFNYNAMLYTLALMYRYGALGFKDINYYYKSVDTFKNALITSPTRPGFIYGLFDLQVAAGDFANAKETGKTIIKYWPEDEAVRKLVGE